MVTVGFSSSWFDYFGWYNFVKNIQELKFKYLKDT